MKLFDTTRLKILAIVLLASFSSSAFAATVVDLYKSPSCGCCTEWAEILKQEGFEINVHHQQDWTEIKKAHNMPVQMQSCHSAIIDGYLIEGHVPVADIRRLLDEKPNTSGIAAPGMPAKSPGMARPGEKYENFKVIAFSKDGLSIFNEY